MKTPEKYKCDRCLNSRPVISENGLHYNCTLPTKQAVLCMAGMNDKSVLLMEGKADENA